MSTRAGTAISPIFLRVALGVVFVWAGLAKLMTHMEVTPGNSAALVALGLVTPDGTTPTPPPDAKPSPPAPTPPTTPETKPEPKLEPAAEPKPADKPEAPKAKPPSARSGDPVGQVMTVGFQSGAAAPAEPRKVLGLHGLSVLLYNSTYPLPKSDGTAANATWPKWAGSGRKPVYLAWAVTVTELLAGLLVLMGLLTRLGALGLAGVMLGAMWLTEIGPAMASGSTVLGFLPNRPAFEPRAWDVLMFQFTLFMSSLALLFIGSGTISLDRALFGARITSARPAGGG